jgi:LmbE family N-acetylglucosaminyl deacetylase
MDLTKDLTGRRLLLITAHPDDECFAFGGALALAAARGCQTHVLCLTDGQAATHRGDATTSANLGQIRRDEFHASCRVLGVHHAELLDYHDAHLEFVDFSATARRLVHSIRTLQPHIVLTFGADGAPNTHPDHTMVSALTTAAFHWAASAKRFPDAGPTWRATRLYHQSTNFFLPNRPQPLPIPWTVTLDIRQVFETKREAFRQHVSQAPLMEQTKPIFDQHGSHEFYTLVATPEPTPAKPFTDLFEDL